MNDLATEYGLSERESNGNGRAAANGSGHAPATGAGQVNAQAPSNGSDEPPGKDSNAVIPQLRWRCLKSKKLNDHDKLLFCILTDLQFLDRVSSRRGVVSMSKRKLSEHFNCSVRSITRREIKLTHYGFIITRVRMVGGYELTDWYIRGVVEPKAELWEGGDPRFGSTGLRGRQRVINDRDASGQFCPKAPEGAESTDLPAMSALNGQEQPHPTDSFDRGARTMVTVEHGQPCPLSTDSFDRGARTVLTVESGQPCPSSADNGDRGARSTVSDSKETPSGEGSPESTAIKRSTGERSKVGAKKLGESAFMTEVGRVLGGYGKDGQKRSILCADKEWTGKRELQNSGAWWRVALWREAGERLAWSVLTEIERMIQEGEQFTVNPGAAAVDLLGRWK